MTPHITYTTPIFERPDHPQDFDFAGLMGAATMQVGCTTMFCHDKHGTKSYDMDSLTCPKRKSRIRRKVIRESIRFKSGFHPVNQNRILNLTPLGISQSALQINPPLAAISCVTGPTKSASYPDTHTPH